MTRLEAKKLNESLKLVASSINSLGLLGAVSGAIVPYITSSAEPAWLWLPGWLVLMLLALGVLNFLQEE